MPVEDTLPGCGGFEGRRDAVAAVFEFHARSRQQLLPFADLQEFHFASGVQSRRDLGELLIDAPELYFNRLQVANTANNVTVARINGLYQPLLQTIGFLGKAIILLYGGYLCASGQMMIATQRGLGVNHPSSEYLFCVIASPAASYFASGAKGIKPVTVWLSQEYTRAAPGGTGGVKTGGNYAAAFVAQQQAVDRGCDQVVWLDAAEHRWVEEMGGMNLFFVRGGDTAQPWIATPPLTGTLLPGITRDSLLKLAPQLGIKAVEEPITIDQWQAECQAGELTEVFACGTAAVITPVGRVKGEHAQWLVADGEPGPVTMRLREELVGIQYGHKPDPFGWIHKVC